MEASRARLHGKLRTSARRPHGKSASAVLGPYDRQISGPSAGTESESPATDDRRHGDVAALYLYRPESQRGLCHGRQCPRSYSDRDDGEGSAASECGTERGATFLSRKSCLTISIVSGACVQPREKQVQELPALRPPVERTVGIGRLPWTCAVGAGDRSWPIAGSEIEGRCGPPLRVFSFRCAGVQQPTRLGLLSARNSGIYRVVSRGSRRSEGSIRTQLAPARNVRSDPRAGLEMV